MIEILIELQQTGKLKKLVQGGVLSPNVYTHLEIFMEYDKRIRLGHNSVDIIFDLSEFFKLSQCYIYRIIKKFK